MYLGLVCIVSMIPVFIFDTAAFAQETNYISKITQGIYKTIFSKKRISLSDQKRRRSTFGIMGVRGLDDPEASLKEYAAPDIGAVYSMEDEVIVTQGALRHSASESQLAALLGHEIAHVSKRHLIASLERKIKSNKSKQTQDAEMDDHAKARRRIKDEDSGQSSEWVRVLGPKGIGVTLLQAASDALDTLLSKGMEADFELEADRLGQQISSASGYESSALAVLIYRLKNQKGATHSTSASTHPPYDIRLKNISAFVRTLASRDAASAKGSRFFAVAQKEWMKK